MFVKVNKRLRRFAKNCDNVKVVERKEKKESGRNLMKCSPTRLHRLCLQEIHLTCSRVSLFGLIRPQDYRLGNDMSAVLYTINESEED